MSLYLPKPPAPREFPDGRDIAKSEIKKIQRRGPAFPSDLRKHATKTIDDAAIRSMLLTTEERAARSYADAALEKVRKDLARGSRPFDPDTFTRGGQLRKAGTSPFIHDIRAQPQSENGQWDSNHHNTGATNDWRNENEPTKKPTRVGGQVIGSPSATNRDAALDAIKRDLARGAQVIGR